MQFHTRKKVVAELKMLDDSNIIETATGPTPWVSPMVAPPQTTRPRQANMAIVHERHLTPTMDDIIHELNGATVFSKLDLKAGYHQLESCILTAGISPPWFEGIQMSQLWNFICRRSISKCNQTKASRHSWCQEF